VTFLGCSLYFQRGSNKTPLESLWEAMQHSTSPALPEITPFILLTITARFQKAGSPVSEPNYIGDSSTTSAKFSGSWIQS